MSDELLAAFLEEAAERQADLERCLMGLESNPEDQQIINEAFRIFHTFKGMAATLEFKRLEKLAHRAETLLDALRKGERTADPDVLDLLLAVSDAVAMAVEAISTGNEEPSVVDLVQRLDKTLRGAKQGSGPHQKKKPAKKAKKAEQVATPQPTEEVPPESSAQREHLAIFLEEARERHQALEGKLIEIEGDPTVMALYEHARRSFHILKGMARVVGLERLQQACQTCEATLAERGKQNQPLSANEIDLLIEIVDLVGQSIGRADEGRDEPDFGPALERFMGTLASGPTVGEKQKSAPAPATRRPVGTSTIRVPTERLSNIVNAVGELMIAKAHLTELLRTTDEGRLKDVVGRIDRLTSSIYQDVLSARMVPLQTVYDRFPRMVRDLARKQKKDLEIVIAGGEAEVDRALIEQLGDPLVHLLRNAVDHGIEDAKQRKKAGKPTKARITVQTRREHDSVVIEVADDGKGIDLKKIRARAVDRGLITAEESETMSENEAYLLLCRPGFSTRDKVTDTSGRGVGMDVVKNWAESVGGSLRITSQLGKGSAIALRLPITLALQRGMIVLVGNERYVLPFDSIQETVDLGTVTIVTKDGRRFVEFNGEKIPLYSLSRLLEVQGGADAAERLAVIVDQHGSKAGLGIHGDDGQQEVVVKNFARSHIRSTVFGGATILRDGRVALILDAAGLMQLAGRIGGQVERVEA